VANILAKGTQAPEFTLHVTPDQTLSLNEFAGRRVILAFYPADWSPVCGDRMTLYNHILPEFRRRGAELLGISVDGAWCHQAFVGLAATLDQILFAGAMKQASAPQPQNAWRHDDRRNRLVAPIPIRVVILTI
jgi:peroxiredoxin